jgi:hypothetical protein
MKVLNDKIVNMVLEENSEVLPGKSMSVYDIKKRLDK